MLQKKLNSSSKNSMIDFNAVQAALNLGSNSIQ